MAVGVVVIHLGRCGSTVLAGLLDQHSQIAWRGEIFEPRIRRAAARHGDGFVIRRDPIKLALRAINSRRTAYSGIEVKPFHFEAFGISLAEFIEGMREAGVNRFVVLDRRNRLRKIVSSRVAARSGVWHVKAGAAHTMQRIRLPVEELRMDRRREPLKRLLEIYDAEFAEARRLLSPDYLDLLYETDILEDPTRGYHRVVDFLGLAKEPVEIKLGRTNTSPLTEVLENYDEVAAHLAGTGYEWMLSE